jgi:hypothetical protein
MRSLRFVRSTSPFESVDYIRECNGVERCFKFVSSIIVFDAILIFLPCGNETYDCAIALTNKHLRAAAVFGLLWFCHCQLPEPRVEL